MIGTLAGWEAPDVKRWIAVVSLVAGLAPAGVVAQPRAAAWSVGDVPARVEAPAPAGSVRDAILARVRAR